MPKGLLHTFTKNEFAECIKKYLNEQLQVI